MSFFSTKITTPMSDVNLSQVGEVPTEDFLKACDGISMIFDVLGSIKFKMLKDDMCGNINRLRGKYESNRSACATLQSIIQLEIRENTHQDKKSCTVGLLWLKRALEFILHFVDLVRKLPATESKLGGCAQEAYAKSLKPFHGMIVGGIFSVAVRSVPTREDLFMALSNEKAVGDDVVLFDMEEFVKGLSPVINAIDQYYKQSKLDSNQK
eukprot:Nk52_evm1s26 gene=Nk52_evmTU1s26